MMRIVLRLMACGILLVLSTGLKSQNNSKTNNLVYVDKQGILRWTKTSAEASFFGVNYTTPFAYSYRAHKALGVDLEKAIHQDVYQLARLGLDAFRVHVWDTEISDTTGNLLENEHLRLFDFLLAELKKRQIKIIITPIAFWGNGYPEKDEATPGFSRKYGKGRATTNDTAILAQENYLHQFFKHINPYTRLNYVDDPDIIAVELNNEPSHSGPKDGVTNYVNRLAAAVRSVGWTKPVYYNIAQNPFYADAVSKANIDGVSFQWYPTGLVASHEMKGNFLPNVDHYRIPFDTIPEFHNKSRMVYEYDAADVLQSNLYPAMARSFRNAGFQWATQFAYDPTALAYANTEYQTHYLNLIYTPSKAISLLIASKAFHQLPRLKSFGSYPADSSFGVFRVSYKNSLSEMNSEEEFYYSNSTHSMPVNIARLRHLAGVGSSVTIHYAGSGAYFLDKISDGVWRLEVMPDAIPIRDPFEKASPEKEVTHIQWQANSMRILLPDLGSSFGIKGLNEGNSFSGSASENQFHVQPGTYLLTARGKNILRNQTNSSAIGLNEFATSKAFTIHRDEPLASTATTQTEVLAEKTKLEIFDPSTDRTARVYPSFRRGYQSSYVTGSDSTHMVLRMSANELSDDHTLGFQYYCLDKLKGRNPESFRKLVIRARTTGTQPVNAKLTLINQDGYAFSTVINLGDAFQNVEIRLDDLKADSMLLLPRPYPGIQPLWFKATGASKFKILEAEKIQVTIGTDILSSEFKKPYGLEVESIWLE